MAWNETNHVTESTQSNTIPEAIFDSVTTGHFLVPTSITTDIKPYISPFHVTLPDGYKIQASHTTLLPIPQLPITAREAHIFPDLDNHSLISIGKLCDSGCIAIFTKTHVYIQFNNITILSGRRHPTSGLYYTTFPDSLPSSPSCSSLTDFIHSSPHNQLIQFYQAVCFSPVKYTWLKAIKSGFFTGCPGLTYQEVLKNYTES